MNNSMVARTYCLGPGHDPRARLVIRTRDFCQSDSGATALEYALMASFIAGMIAATVFVFGVSVRDLFGSVNFPGY